MTLATFICWGAFLFVLNMVDPLATNWVGFLLFYASLFLSLMGTASIVGFLIRFTCLKHELAFRSVKAAFRQSFLFSFLIVAVLFLSSQGFLTWLNLLLLIAGLSLIEYFLISYDRSRLMKGRI
jgi:hypothetical protein